jgi:cytidylate kinase
VPKDPSQAQPQKTWQAAFAADLHLQAGDPRGIERACRLLRACSQRTSNLYLLGDVFDVWTSASLLRLAEMQSLYATFREVTGAGLSIHFLPGNRDFNLTAKVGTQLGFEVGGEHLEVECSGRRFHLCHGDSLLTRDVGYQRLKRVLRSWPARMLAQHLPAPLAQAAARRLRRYSQRLVPQKRPDYLAIVPEAVADLLQGGCEKLICGHVHYAERIEYPGGGELLVLPAFLEEARFAVVKDGCLELLDLEERVTPWPVRTPETAHTHGADPRPEDRCTEGRERVKLSRFGMIQSNTSDWIITIDGPAGAGKSSVARRVAASLGYCYLDTGAMYRAVTLACLRRGLSPEQYSVEEVEETLQDLDLQMDREGRVWLGPEEVTKQLRTAEVTAFVSAVSAHPAVRRAMVELQREAARRFTSEQCGMVAEGRDTGSFVFPHARHRFYLDASVEERARRRWLQEGEATDATESSHWVERIEARDAQDRRRALAPLTVPEGARVVNSTGISEDQVVEQILEAVRS